MKATELAYIKAVDAATAEAVETRIQRAIDKHNAELQATANLCLGLLWEAEWEDHMREVVWFKRDDGARASIHRAELMATHRDDLGAILGERIGETGAERRSRLFAELCP